MSDKFIRAALAGLVAATALLSQAAVAAGGTPYWISPRSNVTMDAQVAGELARDAGIVILRASWQYPEREYDLAPAVKRFKAAGRMPVLAYAWPHRHAEVGRSEVDLFKGLDIGRPVATLEESGVGRVSFLDVTRPEVRARVVERFVDARQRLGVDGFAMDLSNRTPVRGPIGARCRQDANLCPNYAQGMDALFAELRRALGPSTVMAYNGIFNFYPGQIEDQIRLLDNTNLAAVEYFGLDPNEKEHSFSQNIEPYLRAARGLPADKAVMFFGRGPWRYTDYTDDYRWQRYLYASFLLAARDRDMFKYHASFQVPAHAGRAGGLDRYADWRIRMGAPRGPAQLRDGLWRRDFDAGTVVVAPDDGRGGTLRLTAPRFTPEGDSVKGSVTLTPGTGLILLERAPAELRRPERRVISAQDMAAWRWSGATLSKGRLELTPVGEDLTGEHDLMLDGERSLTPYTQLEIDARLNGPGAVVYAVAEVDDRRGESDTLVFVVRGDGANPAPSMEAVPFRSVNARGRPEIWPALPGGRPPASGPISLEGPQMLEGTGYNFRRWSHVRFQGNVSVQEVVLFKPRVPLELPGTR